MSTEQNLFSNKSQEEVILNFQNDSIISDPQVKLEKNTFLNYFFY